MAITRTHGRLPVGYWTLRPSRRSVQVYAIPSGCQREGRGQRMLNCTGVEVKAPRHNSREHPREAATPMTRSRAFAQDNVPRRQNASVTRCCRPQPNGRTRQISPFSAAAHVGALRCTWGRETTCCARCFAVTNSLVLFCGASCDFNAFQSLSRGDNSRHNPKKVI